MRPGPVDGLSADDRELLARLARELGPRLLAYVGRVYRAADAEEVVAEAFCRAAQNMSALRQSARRDLYMLTVVRNLCRDAFRRVRPTTGDVPLDQQPHRAPGPDDDLAAGEQVAALRAAIAELPENLREIVVLRMGSGLTFEEIAGLLRMPLGTALSRMHTAVGELRARLGAV